MKKRRVPLTPYLLLIPPLVLVATFGIYPFIKTIISSFSRTTEVGGWLKWVGFDNWKMVLEDKEFGRIMGNTFKFAAVELWYPSACPCCLRSWQTVPRARANGWCRHCTLCLWSLPLLPPP